MAANLTDVELQTAFIGLSIVGSLFSALSALFGKCPSIYCSLQQSHIGLYLEVSTLSFSYSPYGLPSRTRLRRLPSSESSPLSCKWVGCVVEVNN